MDARCSSYRIKWAFLGILIVLSGCSVTGVERRTDERGQSQAIYRISSEKPGASAIQIGTIGRSRHVVRDVVVRPIEPVCNEKAYVAAFRNSFVDRWDTNVMMDRLPKGYYIDIAMEDLRAFKAKGSDAKCAAESIAQGETDGDRAARRLYGEFFEKVASKSR